MHNTNEPWTEDSGRLFLNIPAADIHALKNKLAAAGEERKQLQAINRQLGEGLLACQRSARASDEARTEVEEQLTEAAQQVASLEQLLEEAELACDTLRDERQALSQQLAKEADPRFLPQHVLAEKLATSHEQHKLTQQTLAEVRQLLAEARQQEYAGSDYLREQLAERADLVSRQQALIDNLMNERAKRETKLAKARRQLKDSKASREKRGKQGLAGLAGTPAEGGVPGQAAGWPAVRGMWTWYEDGIGTVMNRHGVDYTFNGQEWLTAEEEAKASKKQVATADELIRKEMRTTDE